MKHCYAFLLLIINIFCYSQATIVWDKTYDFDAQVLIWSELTPTNDGSYILAGDWRGKSSHMFLVKIDNNGDTLWTKKYGDGKKSTYGYKVSQTSDNGYVIVGEYNRNSYIVKTDSLGNVEWEKSFDLIHQGCANGLYSIEQTSDGGYLIGGTSEFYEPNWGCHDDQFVATVAKLDSLGNIQWNYQSSNSGKIEYSKEIANEEYLIGGSEYYSVFEKIQIITLLDSLGDVVWRSKYSCQGKGFCEMASGFNVSKDTVSFSTADGSCCQFNMHTGDSINQFDLSPHEGDGFGKVLFTNNSIITTEYFYDDNSRTFNKFNELGELQWAVPIHNWSVLKFRNEWPGIVATNDSSYILAGISENERDTFNLKIVKIKESPNGIFDNNSSPSNEIKVFPNPFSDKTSVVLSKKLFSQDVKVKIIDVSGQVIRKFTPESSSFTFNSDNLSAGSYFLEIHTKNQRITQIISIN